MKIVFVTDLEIAWWTIHLRSTPQPLLTQSAELLLP